MNNILHQLYLLLAKLDYLAILLLVFLTVAAVVLGISRLLGNHGEVKKRLERLVSPTGQSPETEQPAGNGLFVDGAEKSIFSKIFRPIQEKIVPRRGETRKLFRLKLLRAGFRSEIALYNFIGAKVVLALVLPATYSMMRFFYKFTPDVIAIAFLLAVVGFFLPDVVVMLLTANRQERMTHALPDALDLMVVCVEAGYGLDMTFKRVGEEMRAICPDLSDEFTLTNIEVRAGRPRDESLKEMANRTGVNEIHNLVTMLVQTNRFGTSLAKALRIHADAMRIKRRQLAEEMAAKSAVKLVFPLVMFIFPALMIVLAGPAFIRIFQALLPAIVH